MENRLNRFPEYVCDGFLALLATLFPLFWGFKGYYKIASHKYPLFLGLFGVFVLLALAAAIVALIGQKDSRSFVNSTFKKFGFPQVLMLGYLAFTVASALFSKYDGVFMGNGRNDGVVTIMLYVLALIVLSLFARPKKWHIWLFAATAAFESVICVLQFSGLDPFRLYPTDTPDFYSCAAKYGEYVGTIGNADFMGAFMCVAVALFVSYFIRVKAKHSYAVLAAACVCLVAVRLLWVMSCIVGIAAFFVFTFPVLAKDRDTGKRAAVAYFACMLTLGIALLFHVDHGIVFRATKYAYLMIAGSLIWVAAFLLAGKINFRHFKKWGFAVIAALIVLALVGLYLMPVSAGGGMVYEIHEMLHGHFEDSFGTSRIYIWRNVLQKLPPHILLGTGPDTMKQALGLEFKRLDADGNVVRRTTIDAAHNEYLNILTNQGIFALLCYLSALVISAYLWLKHSKNDGACIAGAAVLAYCVCAFFNISMYITAPLFIACWGALLAFSGRKEEAE